MFFELKGRQDVKYLEIGVFEGRSLIWVWKNILPENSCCIHAVDSFPTAGTKEVFSSNVSFLLDNNVLEIFHGPSDVQLKKLTANQYDLIYLDGDHSYKGVWNDLVLAWPLLKCDSSIVLDDYFWKKFELPLAERPEKAIDDFLKEAKGSYKILHRSMQVYLQKVAELPSEIRTIDENSLKIPKGGLVLPDGIVKVLLPLIHFLISVKRKLYNRFK